MASDTTAPGSSRGSAENNQLQSVLSKAGLLHLLPHFVREKVISVGTVCIF